MRAVGVGVLCLVAACGDKEAGALDAPRPIDAPPIDAPPDAYACPFDFDYQDRGEVRVELVHHADGSTAARATAFVYADIGGPQYPFVNLDGCTDVNGGTIPS